MQVCVCKYTQYIFIFVVAFCSCYEKLFPRLKLFPLLLERIPRVFSQCFCSLCCDVPLLGSVWAKNGYYGNWCLTCNRQTLPSWNSWLQNWELMVDKAVVDNIMESLYNIHKTFFVISCHALASFYPLLRWIWSRTVFWLNKRTQWSCCLWNMIQALNLSSSSQAGKEVKRKAYLDWPKDPGPQIFLWKNLRDSIRQHGVRDQEI